MKLILVTLLATAALAYGRVVDPSLPDAYGYFTKVGIPEAERIEKAEEEYLNRQSRIINGSPAALGQIPYQAGLISDIVGITGRGVCGGVLINPTRLISAAHCWFDGVNQAWRFTVVLGSILLFSGGTRLESSSVVLHPNWAPSPVNVANDVLVIYLPTAVSQSANIGFIALPSGSDLTNTFAGETAMASGFGLTSNAGGNSDTYNLNHVQLNVIPNSVCIFAFPLALRDSNICTSGVGASTCRGDSGGPLVVSRPNGPILIGITSFGSGLGCEANMPAAFARVTSFMDFFQQHL